MLTYLINVTEDMLALSLLIGMLLAFTDTWCRNSGKLIGKLGLLAGFIAAAVRAYFTNTRRIKNGWKVGTYGYGFSLGFLQNENSGKLGDISQLCLYDNGVSLLLTSECACLSV